MFNLEIKRISLKSIVLSVYPFVVFIFCLLSAFFGINDLINPDASRFATMMQILLYSLTMTAVIVIFTLLACFIYNILASFGIRGVRISLTEVEETSQEEQDEPQAEASAQEENK